MTNKQRFLTAVRGGVPDRVPVSPLIHHRYAHRALGRSDWRAAFEVHQQLGSIAFRGPQGISFDVAWPERFGASSTTSRGADGRTINETTFHTPQGDLTSRHEAGMIPHDPLVGKRTEYWVKSPEDWAIWRRIAEVRLERVRPNLDDITQVWETMGDEGVASAGMGGVFHRLGDVRGMQGLLTDLYDCPDVLEAVFEVEGATVEREVEAFLASPSEVLWYDICIATGGGMSPAMFERWAMPDVRRLAELVGQVEGKYAGLYTLGRIRDVLPMLVESGVDFIETFEPNQGDITLAEAKKQYGDRVCLMGNFDCVILARGTAEEAREEARRCLEEGMEGGGFVLVTGDEVPADAQRDNLKAMVEVVEEHGSY